MALRTNMRSDDRELILEKMDPKSKDTGLVDPGVFEGKNGLHCVMDPTTLMWGFKYERGPVPPMLRNKYTKFSLAKADAEKYLKTKNIVIKDVKDVVDGQSLR